VIVQTVSVEDIAQLKVLFMSQVFVMKLTTVLTNLQHQFPNKKPSETLLISQEIHTQWVTFVKRVDIVPLVQNSPNPVHPDFITQALDSIYPPSAQHVQLVNTAMVHLTRLEQIF